MSMTESQAMATVNTPDEEYGAGAGVEAKNLVPIDDFTTFRAELLIEDGDLVFHFFLAPEVFARAQELQGDLHKKQLLALEERVKAYWLNAFPRSLDVVARNFFNAGPDRLEATYVEDFQLKSWWLKAKGFALDGLSPELRARSFCAKLDQALDAVKINLAPV